LRNKPYCPS